MFCVDRKLRILMYEHTFHYLLSTVHFFLKLFPLWIWVAKGKCYIKFVTDGPVSHETLVVYPCLSRYNDGATCYISKVLIYCVVPFWGT